MSALKSVIITLPKNLAKLPSSNVEFPRNSTPKLNFTTSILADKSKGENRLHGIAKMEIPGQPSQQQQQLQHHHHLHQQDVDVDGAIFKPEVCLRGKKRRLDHLTWEEKLQRKKLKNRVAAQTSRDRKKAKLDELEDTVKTLKERNDVLTQECAMLRSQNEFLIVEMKRLRRDKDQTENNQTSTRLVVDMEQHHRLQQQQQQQPQSQQQHHPQVQQQFCSSCQSRVGCTVPSLGSAVSPESPLQQGGTVQSALPLTLTPEAVILLKILTLYLLSKSSSENCKETTTSSAWRSSQRAFCEKLLQKWRRTLIEQTTNSLPRKLPPRSLGLQRQWWGRHQKMWKPIQPIEA